MPRPLAAKLQRVNEAPQCFIIYPLSYEALQRFIEALSNLSRSRKCRVKAERQIHYEIYILLTYLGPHTFVSNRTPLRFNDYFPDGSGLVQNVSILDFVGAKAVVKVVM